jgi:uncharacterized protein YjbI with pentapeptide repeats
MKFVKKLSYLIGETFSNPTSSSNVVSVGEDLITLREGGDYSGVDLSGVDLSGVNLTNVNLTNAKLHGANLTNANLTNANLTKVDFSASVVSGTTFDGSITVDADFDDVVYSVPPSGIEIKGGKK